MSATPPEPNAKPKTFIDSLSQWQIYALFVLICVFGFSFDSILLHVLDRLTVPWAYGDSTLTGRWKGHLSFAGVGSRPFQLEIVRIPIDSRHDHGSFQGSAELVDGDGYRTQFRINGNSNRNGSKIGFRLDAENRKNSPKMQATVYHLDAVWRGQTLELNGNYSMAIYHGENTRSNSDWPSGKVTGTLTKP